MSREALSWSQPAPADRESTDVDRGEIWYNLNGYLLRQEDTEAFMAWAESVDFGGAWMPDPPEFYKIFLGEHGWSPASDYFEQPYFGDSGWTEPGQGCPVRVRCIALEYLQESSTFDCSVDETLRLRLPVRDLLSGLRIRWSGIGADYIDGSGKRVVFDPTVHESGPSALLIQESSLRDYLQREKLGLCWAVLGEKRVLGGGFGAASHPSLHMSGAYMLSDKGPAGFLKCFFEDRDSTPRPALVHLKTIKTAS